MASLPPEWRSGSRTSWSVDRWRTRKSSRSAVVAEPSGELAFIALGSNLGERAARLAQARAALSLIPGSRVVALSSIEETAPLGGLAQPPYLNQMVALHTTLEPLALLLELHRIEH